MKAVVRLALCLAGWAAPLAAQQDAALSITLVEEPRAGRPAPAVRLPYVTREGRGPATQPFDLGRELGRVVVLAFRGPGDPVEARARWRQFAAAGDSVIGGGVVLAGISAVPDSVLLGEARDLGLPFKLLADSGGRTARRLGLDRASTTVLVVGRDGRVFYREDRLPAGPLLPASKLAAAIRAAKEAM